MNIKTSQNVRRIYWLTAVIAILLLLTLSTTQAATGTTYHVRIAATGDGSGSNWANATTLQGALSIATSGDEIWVAEGIYKPTSTTDETISFNLVPGVAIYGGFDPDNGIDTFNERNWAANPTVLSGDIDDNDTTSNGVVTTASNISGNNTYHVVVADGTTSTPITGTTILDGFTITAGQANGVTFPNWYGGGFLCLGDGSGNECSPTLTHIIFAGNTAGSGGGMYNSGRTGGSSNPTLTNITFFGNSAPNDSGGGMHNNGSQGTSSPTLTNVTFSGNVAGFGGGLYSDGISNPTLTNVIMWGNMANFFGDELHDNGSAASSISYSLIKELNPAGTGNLDGTDAANDPLFVDEANGDLRLQAGSPAIDAGNNSASGLTGIPTDLDANPRIADSDYDGTATVDLGTYEVPLICPSGTALHVDQNATGNASGSDWTNAMPDLAEALTKVPACGVSEIWVAKGVYKPTTSTDPTISFNLIPGVAVYGGFDPAGGDDQFNERDWRNNPTILSGDIDNNDPNTDGVVTFGEDIVGTNSYHVVIADGTAGTPITASTILDGFTITAGEAVWLTPDDSGGGFLCVGEGNGSECSPTLTNIIFSGNYGNLGGGMYNSGRDNGISNPILSNVSFVGNSAASGGGMYNDAYNDGTSNPTLSNASFIGNYATEGGGGIRNISSGNGINRPELTNVTFSGNSAYFGGGMHNSRYGGVSTPTLTNVIMWGNTVDGEGNEIHNTDGATVDISYSLIKGWNPAGTGNLDGTDPANDPLFVDATNRNLRLQASSPAIETGDNGATGLSGITTDLDGNPRFVDRNFDGLATVDMGAYETPAVCPNTAMLHVDHVASGDDSGSDWTNAMLDLRIALNKAAACSIAEVWVAKGIYKPTTTTNRSLSFNLMPNVAVYGGFNPAGGADEFSERDWINNPTVLSGDIDNNDTHTNGVVSVASDISGNNSYHVVIADGRMGEPITRSTIMDGFIITAGRANGAGDASRGAGFLCIGSGNGNSCNPTITNVKFSGHWASFGGGMANDGMDGGESSPLLTHVTFSHNFGRYGGGGMFNFGKNGISSPILINVNFSENRSAHGGGMYNFGPMGISSPTLTNVIFFNNLATSNGGGMYNNGHQGVSSPTLTNVTFFGNLAMSDGGGMKNVGSEGSSNPTLTNVIMWEDSASGMGNEIFNDEATLDINYSLIEGLNPTGTNNLDGTNAANNPLFVDASNGNLGLQDDSPAIDVGNNSAPELAGITTDIAGRVRLFDGDSDGIATVDMGAYEAIVWLMEITAVNATDAQLVWEPIDHFVNSCTYNIFESTTPYFDPINLPTYSTSNLTQMLDDKLITAGMSYFYINEVTCDQGTATSNEVGIFNFEIAPGTP